MDMESIVLGTIFTALGAILAAGKLHPYLAVWKTMPQEKKKNININALCRNIGEVTALFGIIFLLNGFWINFRQHLFAGTMIAWLIVAGADVWFINKGSRYKNNCSARQGR